MTTPATARLLVACRDRPGLIAEMTAFVASRAGNIVRADQHTDADTGEFFMRLEVERATLGTDRGAFEAELGELAGRLEMDWRLEWGDRRPRMVVLVSRQDHCLSDLLWRWRAGELAVDLPLVVSNHEDCRAGVASLGVRYEVVPVTPETKAEAEARLLGLLDEVGADLVVLARYMQVLSPRVVEAYRGRIINIHHSFLPAFPGAKPYHRAHDRGVKIIGATSHYVTEDLDEGPIIAQATAHVDHRDTVRDLIRTGRDLERVVLAQAVRLHVEDLVLTSGRRTVVFD